jgi:hypothetical protein
LGRTGSGAVDVHLLKGFLEEFAPTPRSTIAACFGLIMSSLKSRGVSLMTTSSFASLERTKPPNGTTIRIDGEDDLIREVRVLMRLWPIVSGR